MKQRILELSAYDVSNMIRRGELSAVEYVAKLLERIEEMNKTLNCYITVVEREALAEAEAVDRMVKRGEDGGLLCGVGVAVKDNICTEGIKTTCGSHILESFIPPYDATVVERIKAEHGVILGKTNLDEFAMGSTTEFSCFNPSRNPYDSSRVPGGSSGGSGAALAGYAATLALGSDTGGSVRCPASFCSITALKPTYGLVSRYGLIAYANSLEQIAPMARYVQDCALLLSCIAGHDSRDSTSAPISEKDYTFFLKDDVRKLRIGVPREFFGEGTSEAVAEKVWKAISKLESLGASYEEFSLPILKYSLAAYYIVAMSEASSNLARYDGVRYGLNVPDKGYDWSSVFSKVRSLGFGEEVKRRIILGTYALTAGYFDMYYLKAQKVRTLIRREFEKAFKKYDVLVGPTMPLLPFKLGEKLKDPLEMYMCDIDTVPANLTGLPAISIPCGFHDNLPIGLQIMAPHFREDLLLKAAYTFEQNTRIVEG